MIYMQRYLLQGMFITKAHLLFLLW